MLLRVNCETELIKAYLLEFNRKWKSKKTSYPPSLGIHQEVLFQDNHECDELPLVNAPGPYDLNRQYEDYNSMPRIHEIEEIRYVIIARRS